MADNNQNDLVKIMVRKPLSKERQNPITYKRKGQTKNPYRSATDDEDLQSASSYKASNPPLPQLQKDRRKLIIKPFGSIQPKNNNNNFVQKEVRQHDNILLKQRNNLLANQNLKLKTKITVLEKQNEKLQKMIDNDQSQTKPITAFSNSRDKMRPVDTTLRAVIRGLRKQIEDYKKENVSIKSTVKFTSLKELEVQRDSLAEQTIRLRLALQQQQARRTNMKANSQGVNALEHRLHTMSERNASLMRQHSQMAEKIKKLQQNAAKSLKAIQNQRNITKALTQAKKTILQKQNEIQALKNQLKSSSGNISTTNISNTTKQNKFDIKRVSIEKKTKNLIPTSYNKIQNNSAQKIGYNKDTLCKKCPKLENQIKTLKQMCKKLQANLNRMGTNPLGTLSKNPIEKITQIEVTQLKRFLMLRFKAHRLTHEDSQKYLLNCQKQLSKEQLQKQMSVRQLMQSLFVEPFCVASNRYLQIFIAKLIYGDSSQPIKIDQQKKVSKTKIFQAYLKLLPKFDIMSQQKEEQMFIQVAQLITTYYQQILAALTAKRNGQGTISQPNFLQFFKQIELEQEYIDFIITQIILESLDMEHLNFYAMFEIFYMPQITASAANSGNPQGMKKKKFQVSHENVVHEQDEQYEESKSHLGRNKTLEHHEQDQQQKYKQQQNYDWQQSHGKQNQNKALKKQQGNEQQYAQEYEQQKMNDDPNNQSNVKQYIIAQDEFS